MKSLSAAHLSLLLVPSLCALAPAMAAKKSSAPASSQGDLQDILARARVASGVASWPQAQHLVLAGESVFLGVETSYRSRSDGQGRFERSVEGDLERMLVHDGETLWEKEYRGVPFGLELWLRECELLRAWVHSGYWLCASPQLSITLVPLSEGEQREDAALILLDLTVKDGLTPGRLALDAQTHLPLSLTFATGNGHIRDEFSDYRKLQGVRIAHELRSEPGVQQMLSIHIREARFEPKPQAGCFAKPSACDDYWFSEDDSEPIRIVRSRSGHMFVPALVNGQEIGHFLFDTGAGFSGLTKGAADELGLVAFGQTSLTGLGGGVTSKQMYRATSLQIGALMIDDLLFTDSSDGGRKSRMAGRRVVGVLGWDIMSRAVVEVEPAGDELFLRNPENYELSSGEWTPLTLHYKVPFAKARFSGGREGLFMLDTGAGSTSVMFFSEAARRFDLLKGIDTSKSMSGTGGGGQFEMTHGNLEYFEFAGDARENDEAIFNLGDDGESDPYTVGLVGGGILRLYRIVFDYQEGRAAFLPR